ECLKELNFRRNKSDLEHHRDLIEEYFMKHPPAGIKEAMAAIEKLTGVRRSENRVREYLKSIGIKRRKVGMIPAKADPDRQEDFLKEELKPRLKEAEEGRRAVFF
ncbi:MAG: IS630 family transposase, partial [Candidatus Electrothrix sp. LOE2]|nr:IS630 family transposase [Candidatus Electrothrix sp. LOE2]